MRQETSKDSVSGVITVYLALVLLLILSLIFTVIEGARVSTAKVYAHRALSTAMDSAWAEYYGPLWKEYHIFGYSAGEGSRIEKAEKIEEKLTQYMNDTFQPNAGRDSEYGTEYLELYDINISSLAVTDQTLLIEDKGELLIKEAVEYMKYHELADGLTLLLEKVSLLEKPKKVSAVYDKKLAAEVELAKADKNILRLMELLDGVKTSKNGIKLDKNGKLIVTEYFTKMLCSTPLSKEAVGINHKAVYEAVRRNYINPDHSFSQISSELEQLLSLREQLIKLKEEIATTQVALYSMNAQLRDMNGVNQTKEMRQERKTLSLEINSLQEQLSELSNQEQELLELIATLKTSVGNELKRFNRILQELMPILEDAEQEAVEVITNATTSYYLIDDFEEVLYEERGSLGDEMFARLEEKLKEMKQYTAAHEEKDSYYAMIDTLQYNGMTLEYARTAIQNAQDRLSEDNYSGAKISSDAARLELQKYNISTLTIDYSSLILDDTKQQNPVEEIGQLIQSGISGLVLDPDSISEQELSAEQLPSVEASLTKDPFDFTSMITAFFKDSMEGGERNEMGNLLYDFRDSTELSTRLAEGINLITEHLLYQEYLKEHFESYPVSSTQGSSRKPSALIYELEYLLEGNRTDIENLSSVISRIVFVRMILDFVTLLGDKTRCEEAKLAASAIVGFSGLPMLINITQAALLMVWSFAEALVDTCALLMGKEVPILKEKIVLQFHEMFLLNRSFLRTKADSYTESSRLSFSYLDYLRIFLLIKQKQELACRSMDLIQENLNLRYVEKIYLRDCLFGFEASADYTMDTKFIAIPFLRNYLEHDMMGYRFTCKADYCY